MKASIEIDLSFNQILAVVKQLPRQQKIRLTKELEKQAIDTRLSKLLKTFNSEDVDMNLIDEEVERVRQQIYDQKKR